MNSRVTAQAPQRSGVVWHQNERPNPRVMVVTDLHGPTGEMLFMRVAAQIVIVMSYIYMTKRYANAIDLLRFLAAVDRSF